jgi:hypothetical protein
MNENDEVITLSVLVEGNSNKEIVSFKVFRDIKQYKAVPMLTKEQRKRTGLAEVICFSFVDHCIVSEKSRSEETLEVIRSLILEMMMQEVLY